MAPSVDVILAAFHQRAELRLKIADSDSMESMIIITMTSESSFRCAPIRPPGVTTMRFLSLFPRCSPLLFGGYRSSSIVVSSKPHFPPSSSSSCRRHFASSALQIPVMYSAIERGRPNTTEYRLFFRDGEGPISPFHDIPLHASDATSGSPLFHMVVEIPRWTNAKMEISTSEPLNPIKQDVKKEKLRFVHNCFPHHGYIWNYGALPQTWENPQRLDESTGCKGDDDPIDCLEIGHRVAKRGEVLKVKVLGIMGLIDEGETDWKVLTIDIRDPMAEKLNDVKDIEEHFPGLLKATHEWFKIYKIPDGKPANQFAFNGEAKEKEFALRVIEETHKYWEELLQTPQSDACPLSRGNVTLENSAFKMSRKEAEDTLEKSPSFGIANDIPTAVDKWHFVQMK